MLTADEARFLITICRHRLLAPEAELVRSLARKDLNWERLFVSSLWHKVAFVVMERLRSERLLTELIEGGGLPLLLLNHWIQLEKVNEIRNSIYLDALAEIDAAFSTSGLPWAVAKGGPLLIGRVYTARSRKLYDLDLLLERRDLPQAEQIMYKLGYEYADYNYDTGELQATPGSTRRKWLLLGRGVPNLIRRVESGVIDYVIVQLTFQVGTTKRSGETIPAASLLPFRQRRGQLVAISDCDLLLQLLLHLYRETTDETFTAWDMDWNLIKFCDIDRFLDYLHAGGFDFREFVDRVNSLHMRRQCVYALDATANLFPSVAAAEVLKQLTGSAADNLAVPGREQLVANVSRIGLDRPPPGSVAWEALVGRKAT